MLNSCNEDLILTEKQLHSINSCYALPDFQIPFMDLRRTMENVENLMVRFYTLSFHHTNVFSHTNARVFLNMYRYNFWLMTYFWVTDRYSTGSVVKYLLLKSRQYLHKYSRLPQYWHLVNCQSYCFTIYQVCDVFALNVTDCELNRIVGLTMVFGSIKAKYTPKNVSKLFLREPYFWPFLNPHHAKSWNGYIWLLNEIQSSTTTFLKTMWNKHIKWGRTWF